MWDSTSNRVMATATKGAKGIVSVCAHWDSYFLRAVLSSVSKQATKMAKNGPFLSILPLGLCGTVASNKEASKLHFRYPRLEK